MPDWWRDEKRRADINISRKTQNQRRAMAAYKKRQRPMTIYQVAGKKGAAFIKWLRSKGMFNKIHKVYVVLRDESIMSTPPYLVESARWSKTAKYRKY